MEALQTATNISFKNVLFLTDFSEASEAAFAYALGIARHFGAELFPAHASDPAVLAETLAESVVEDVVEHSEKRLKSLVADDDVHPHPLFTRGSIETALPRWINENGIDLVVIGTHGRRGVDRLILGSTAEHVFRNAACPVLTVGPHVAHRPYHGFTAENVLFPTKLGSYAEFGSMYALSFAREAHGKVSFMNIVNPEEAGKQDRTDLINDTYRQLQKLVPSDAQNWCKTELLVEVGNPALEILGYAEKERPDLIVLGLPYQKQFNTHFRAGITFKIISAAPCPVLTVRDLRRE